MDWKRGFKRILLVLEILWVGGILLFVGPDYSGWGLTIKIAVIGAVVIAVVGEIIIWVVKGFIKAKPDQD
jgi:hypothetical protein